jgi:hypothetical protein
MPRVRGGARRVCSVCGGVALWEGQLGSLDIESGAWSTAAPRRASSEGHILSMTMDAMVNGELRSMPRSLPIEVTGEIDDEKIRARMHLLTGMLQLCCRPHCLHVGLKEGFACDFLVTNE